MKKLKLDKRKFFMIDAAILVVILAIGAWAYQRQQAMQAIDTFEGCAAKYPVMESYPEQCNTPDGRHFVKQY